MMNDDRIAIDGCTVSTQVVQRVRELRKHGFRLLFEAGELRAVPCDGGASTVDEDVRADLHAIIAGFRLSPDEASATH
jgi:hypothetical protein